MSFDCRVKRPIPNPSSYLANEGLLYEVIERDRVPSEWVNDENEFFVRLDLSEECPLFWLELRIKKQKRTFKLIDIKGRLDEGTRLTEDHVRFEYETLVVEVPQNERNKHQTIRFFDKKKFIENLIGFKGIDSIVDSYLKDVSWKKQDNDFVLDNNIEKFVYDDKNLIVTITLP
jgi:hypothetical protein